jgi:hypothetical protein
MHAQISYMEQHQSFVWIPVQQNKSRYHSINKAIVIIQWLIQFLYLYLFIYFFLALVKGKRSRGGGRVQVDTCNKRKKLQNSK